MTEAEMEETAAFVEWTERLLVLFVGSLYFDYEHRTMRARLTQELYDFWKQSMARAGNP